MFLVVIGLVAHGDFLLSDFSSQLTVHKGDPAARRRGLLLEDAAHVMEEPGGAGEEGGRVIHVVEEKEGIPIALLRRLREPLRSRSVIRLCTKDPWRISCRCGTLHIGSGDTAPRSGRRRGSWRTTHGTALRHRLCQLRPQAFCPGRAWRNRMMVREAPAPPPARTASPARVMGYI